MVVFCTERRIHYNGVKLMGVRDLQRAEVRLDQIYIGDLKLLCIRPSDIQRISINVKADT